MEDKKKYVSPVVVPLGESPFAVGACQTGTAGDTHGENCVAGSQPVGAAASNCQTGNVATAVCLSGQAATGGGCATGYLPHAG